jgi:4-hydroxybenzoate polyprenyltransferase
MKRITWWPQAWLGLTFNWGALLGFAAATGEVTAPALLLYASGVFWTLGYDTVYAIQDLEDDALAGVKSSARKLGARAPQAVLGFYLNSLMLLAAMGLLAGLTVVFYLLLGVYALILIRQARRVRVDDPALALRLFKSNTWAGVILFAAIVAGGRLALGS